jgi:hypothetical protein
VEPQTLKALTAHNYWYIVESLLGLKTLAWTPSQANVDCILESGRIMTLAKLFLLPQPCCPSHASINNAALLGHVESLFLVHDKCDGALPEAVVFPQLYARGKLETIQFLYTVSPTFKTSQLDFNTAAVNGHVRILQYCHLRDDNLLLDLTTVACAKMNGYYDVEEWFILILEGMQAAGSLPEIRMKNDSDQTMGLGLVPAQVKLVTEALMGQHLYNTARSTLLYQHLPAPNGEAPYLKRRIRSEPPETAPAPKRPRLETSINSRDFNSTI